jgi:hypothetical protein
MKNLGLALAIAGSLVVPRVAMAKGSGGHGGGHSGGHASASHGSSGRSTSHTSHTPSRSAPSAHGTATAGGATSVPPSDNRARNGQPTTGSAVPRATTTSPVVVRNTIILTRGIRSFGLYGLYFDPFLLRSYGYGYPAYGYGYTNPYTYGSGGYAGYAPYSPDLAGPTGGLRLKIEPKDAEVFVDGYYAGVVDDFDGTFRHLTLPVGRHHIEVRGAGYLPLEFDVMTESHQTTTIRDALRR